jgi:hypothetical protein
MSIFAISDKLSLESTGGISLPKSAGSTDNTDTDAAISQTEHNTDTETEADATMSETDNITDTNTDTDSQVTAHNSTDDNEPTIELETETMVIAISWSRK